MGALNRLVELWPENSSPEKGIRAGAAKILYDLQLKQIKHDDEFHKDIVVLSMERKLSHMSHHFAKYTGQMLEIKEDSNLIRQTLVDTFVISLICGNVLNIDLGKETIFGGKESQDLVELGKQWFYKLENSQNDLEWFAKALAISNAKFARACEKLDHLEAFPFKEEISNAAIEICQLVLAAAFQAGLDLNEIIYIRWEEIEKRSIFKQS